MTFAEWRKKHKLTQPEAAAIAGCSTVAVSNAERSGRAPGFDGDRMAAILEGELPEFEFCVDADDPHQPVIVITQIAYGPADVVRGDGRIAAHIVLLWACAFERTEDQYQMAKRFLRFWPVGPQLR